MAGFAFTSQSQATGSKNFAGGLNSTAGPLSLDDSESSDLQNIDFDIFGSILKRNGYTVLNPVPTSGTSLAGDGLYWYEFQAGTGTAWTRSAVHVTGGKVLQDVSASGTWTNLTGSVTVTAGNHCDFETFLGDCYITNGYDAPIKLTGSGTAVNLACSVTTAKFAKVFNNYLFLGNVTISGTAYSSRVYWSEIKNTSAWTSTNFIAIAQQDGEEITGMRVLSDRLVVYKDRSIYNIFFTGDADIPFYLPGGGKTNSNVGCVCPWSIQEVQNGHVFLSFDGLYYFDGNNSYKLSDRVRSTLLSYTKSQYVNAASLNYKTKNRYLLALTNSTNNNRVLVWDYFNNAFSLYVGVNASDMACFYINGVDERPYFSDYNGFTYRMDVGTNDYPSNTSTAISAYYWTNWRTYDDLVDQKGIPNVYVYFQLKTSILSLSYSYDFVDGEQYTQTFSMAGGVSTYGSALYGTGLYSSAGGAYIRRDLTGRGRLVRFKFANSTLNETFRIDGLGSFVHLETHV